MSIQSTVNQGISLASFLFSQSPMVKEASENRIKGRALQKGQEEATTSLRDIRRNIERADISSKLDLGPSASSEDYEKINELGYKDYYKDYSETELSDIESRIRSDINAIYDAKTGSLNPGYSRFIEGDYISQPEIKSMLTDIESGISRIRGRHNLPNNRLEQVERATESARAARQARQIEQAPSRRYKVQIPGMTFPGGN